MADNGGNFPTANFVRFVRFRWNGLGFVEPANMPTYAKGGSFDRTPLPVAFSRSLSSCSSSNEFSTLSTTNGFGVFISSGFTSHFTEILKEEVAWSQHNSLICHSQFTIVYV